MKKSIIILAFILLAFTPEKKYKFEFNDAELNALYNCIDNSNAPHMQVKEVEALIQSQLKGQIDTTKHK
jgi:hypothetical protein